MPRLALTSIVTGMALALGAQAQANPPVFQFQPQWKPISQPKILPYLPPPAAPVAPVAPVQPYLIPPNAGHGHGHHDRVTLGFLGHFHEGEGMYVDRVFHGSLAQQLGLEPGDVIVRINNRRLNCEHDYHDALEDARRIRLIVRDVNTGRFTPTRTVFVGHHHGHGPVKLYSNHAPQSQAF